MSENAESTTLSQLTLFAEECHVNHLVLPGSDEARRMTATSGRKLSALLKNSGPIGLFLRMLLESEQLFSTRCYLTWRGWSTPAGRLIYLLEQSEPDIEGLELLLLPTPGANDWKTSHRWGQRRGQLTEWVENIPAWIPCPTCEDFWCTVHQKHAFECDCPDLEECDEAGWNPYETRPPGMKLNPVFVEWLMGFPLGWTDLEHSETP